MGKKTRKGFKVGEYVVYPTHGVGRISDIDCQEVAGFDLELFVIDFPNEKMTVRVPTTKVATAGMRSLSSPSTMASAMTTLKGRAKVKRTMWSRRAQEYEAKINSGDPLLIAEVVRDLYRAEGQPEQSYSERQIYETAFNRLAQEVAVVESIDREAAGERMAKQLTPAPSSTASPAA